MRSVNSKEFRKAMIDADYDSFGKLEADTGIDRASLSNYAKGVVKPSYDSICKLADAFHLKYDEIGRIFYYNELAEVQTN